MRILVIAPQPFYQQRGTPIATRILVETLRQDGHSVDILTYHLGENPALEGVRIFRTARVPFVQSVPIGFSARKLICDAFLSLKLLVLAKRRKYDVLHAVEEAVFPAVLCGRLRGLLVTYDMDSSLVEQMLDRFRILRSLSWLLCRLEKLAVAGSDLVIPVCNELAVRANRYRTGTPVSVVEDCSLVSSDASIPAIEDLRQGLSEDAVLAMYVGNLEQYQGVDLMLAAFAKARMTKPYKLVVIGGKEEDVHRYRDKAFALGLRGNVDFIGPRSIEDLGSYLLQADVLVSPRLVGTNTPMKLYSYLGAGKAILATRIDSHTQVLDDDCALLADPTSDALAAGIARLAADKQLRTRLGSKARELAVARYSLTQYRRALRDAYRLLETSPRFAQALGSAGV